MLKQHMALPRGFEPLINIYEIFSLPLAYGSILVVLITRIELVFNAYETFVLPLNDTSILLVHLVRIELTFHVWQTYVIFHYTIDAYALILSPHFILAFE